MLEANNSYKVTAIDIMSLLRSDSDGNVTIDFDNGKQVKGQLRIPEYQRPYAVSYTHLDVYKRQE